MVDIKEKILKRNYHAPIIALVVFLIFFGLFYNLYIKPPTYFPAGVIVKVEAGTTVSQIAIDLQQRSLIRSPFLFSRIAAVVDEGRGIVAGDYYFDQPANMFTVIDRLVSGDHRLTPVKVTIPEGYNVFDIAALFQKKFPLFDAKKFIESTQEGYLFPDTYFFLPNVTYPEVISLMRKNFDVKILTLASEIKTSKKSLKDIITMASILEGEARTPETRKMISGILWKRLSLGIPLQVDAAFQYVNGKNSFELTSDDLKIDSPYNTYKYKGFPPTPISNPGLDSINAALSPTKSDYLYFLTDSKGVMHYAKTFEEHVANKALYIP